MSYEVELIEGADHDHKDSLWYTDGATGWVATVKGDGREIDVLVCGEMRLYMPTRNADGSLDFDETEIVRYVGDMPEWVTNDQELQELCDAADAASHDLWGMNSWFELCEPGNDGECYEHAIAHDLFEAIETAKKLLAVDRAVA